MSPHDDSGDSRRSPAPRPDYHDPTARWAGAPEALSALTLRLWLAAFGLVVCAAAAAAAAVVGAPVGWVVGMAVLAAVAVVDLVVVVSRKRRGEPG